MSHGNNLIISRSKLKPQYREAFLTAEYFVRKPQRFEEFTTWFNPLNPENNIQETIVEFLKDQSYDYSGKRIEYWFQHHKPGNRLDPHCDYNHKVRAKGTGGEWLHTYDRSIIMSPITIACYLQITDLVGGELAISPYTWFEEPFPLTLNDDSFSKIYSADVQYIAPEQDDVLYFEGSKYYHWIQEVKHGERKSMMINFWPLDLGILEE